MAVHSRKHSSEQLPSVLGVVHESPEVPLEELTLSERMGEIARMLREQSSDSESLLTAATQFAVEQFSKAGISLASAVGAGAAKGLETALGNQLSAHGLNNVVLRRLGMILAGVLVFGATMVILGMPVRWMLKPVTWPLRMVLGRKAA